MSVTYHSLRKRLSAATYGVDLKTLEAIVKYAEKKAKAAGGGRPVRYLYEVTGEFGIQQGDYYTTKFRAKSKDEAIELYETYVAHKWPWHRFSNITAEEKE